MADTVTVRRGGSYLTIPALAVDRYVAKGYDVVDDNGGVLRASTPNDVNVLKSAFEKHVAEIAQLKKENEALKKEITELKSQPKEVIEPVVEVEKTEAPTVSKPRRSKKSEQ